MTYHEHSRPLSGLEKYLGITQEKDEIYVLRLRVSGVQLTKVTHALAFVRAVGKAFAGGYVLGIGRMDYDVRGIILNGQADQWTLDVVCTFSGETGPFTPNYFRSAQDLATEINVDQDLRSLFPNMVLDIPGAAWFYMDGEDLASDISFWLGAPILYDHTLGGEGNVTQAFGEGRGVWFGENGKRVRVWTMDQPPPIGPGPVPGTESTKAEDGSLSTMMMVLLVAGGLALAWYVSTSEKRA